ncbi:MAG: hypothetical protein MK074_09610, partial [Phycisphaerales bacterium]|nr:hypothetical protein [Phycisphaerales bacterium]
MPEERLLPSAVRYVTTLVDLLGGTRDRAAQLQQTHTDTLAQIHADCTAEHKAAHAHAAAVIKAADAVLNDTLTSTTTRIEKKIDRLEKEYGARRTEILDESETIRWTASKRADEGKWLAESMYEAALTEPEKAIRGATAELTDATQRGRELTERITKVAPSLKGGNDAFPPGPELPDAALIDTTLIEAQRLIDVEIASMSTTVHRWIARFVMFAVPAAAGIVLHLTEILPQGQAFGGGFGLGAIAAAAIWFIQTRTRRKHLSNALRLIERSTTMAKRRRDILAQRYEAAEQQARTTREAESKTARAHLADQIERAGPRMERRLEKLGAIKQDKADELQSELTSTTTQAKETHASTTAQAASDRNAQIEAADTTATSSTTAQHEALQRDTTELESTFADGCS